MYDEVLLDCATLTAQHARVATQNDAVRPSRPVAQQPSSTRPMSMVYSGGATRMSRESLPDQALRASISTPALPSAKPNAPKTQAVAHTERAPRKPVPAKRVDSKIGQPEESKDVKSSDLSTLDDFPLPPTQLKSPTALEQQVKPDVKVDAKRLR